MKRRRVVLCLLFSIGCGSSPSPVVPEPPAPTPPPAPAAHVGDVFAAYGFDPLTPQGYPLHGMVENSGPACARTIQGRTQLVFPGHDLTLTWALPGLVLAPNVSAPFVACCAPPEASDQDVQVFSLVSAEPVACSP